MSEIIAIKKDGKIIDTQTANDENIKSDEEILYDNSSNSLELIRHSTAHLLAQAIKTLYPEAKFFVGPVIEDGFYYDFKINEVLSDKDLKSIEKQMLQHVKKKIDITKKKVTRNEALKKYEDDNLKTAVLSRIEDEEVSFYEQGEFEDLCRGPHVPNTKYLRFFKLTKISGAYLGGDSKNEMLTRIYGTAFASKEALKEHLEFIEEAKKRDHRVLGNTLKLFSFSEDIGAGLPIWLPNGARLREKLEHWLFKAHRLRGYEPVRAPEMLKSEAWKISGHYDNYGENMYFTQINEGDDENPKITEYGIKPMNCVGHIKVYESDVRSYKDLPLKFFEYGVVHRHEMSGALHGLFRVREFTQDDAHIYCMPSQIKDSVIEVLDFVKNIMDTFGFKYELMVSTKPEKAIGDDKVWEVATDGLKEALQSNNIEYSIDEGGGAFYGPKIDIKITDALKRKWQCGTIQVDFNLPARFKLEYVNEKSEREQPVMIHRAILGSFERFIGILTEHCGGEFPLFIAPYGVGIVPISEDHLAYSEEIQKELLKVGIDCFINDKNDSLNKRIRVTEKMKIPYVLVLGDKEIEEKTVAVRDRVEKTQYNLTKDEFFDKLVKIKTKVEF